MAFDLNRFYRQLDEHYAAHDNTATEQFFKDSRQKAYQDGLADPLPAGCPSCAPPIKPNMAYVSVCNEMACFYRGLSRFQDSLDAFAQAQEELESLCLQNTAEYATILLNKEPVVIWGIWTARWSISPGLPESWKRTRRDLPRFWPAFTITSALYIWIKRIRQRLFPASDKPCT